MAYKIIASKLLQKKIIALNDYLQKEWGFGVASRFHEMLIKTILTIAGQPGIGSVSKKKDVRKILITKHNRLCYKEKNNESILLLTLFDTRQNPKRNSYD